MEAIFKNHQCSLGAYNAIKKTSHTDSSTWVQSSPWPGVKITVAGVYMFLGKLVKFFFYLFKIADDLVIYLSSTVESGIDYLYDLGQVLFNFTQFLCVYKAGLLLFHTITIRSEWDHTTHFPRDDGASTRDRALPELER